MDHFLTYLFLGLATLAPVLLTWLLSLLKNKTKFGKLNYWVSQAIIGVCFGILASLATQFGVDAGDGVAMNVRDASPLAAGLFFGAPAGIIAGVIGGGYRFLYSFIFQTGWVTQWPCSVATLLAGCFAALLRRNIFENRKCGMLSSLGIGATMEVFHMFLVLLFNLYSIDEAFNFVRTCSLPMIICNALALFFSCIASGLVKDKESVKEKSKRISYDFGFRLLMCILVSFIVTSGFTAVVVSRVSIGENTDANTYRQVTIYLIIFIQILIYAAIFVAVYEIIKKRIVRKMEKVNAGLNSIASGNLDTVIDVRDNKEFSDLSDDVNATVNSLKGYIKEANERLNKELEVAHQIQHSALNTVFPPYPNRHDFELFASMDAAKEVGGDFYDFGLLDPYNLVVLIADVSGKGVPAAMFMMNAKSLIKGLLESGRTLEEAFNEANKRLCEQNEAEMFITSWIGKLDLRTGVLEYVNAGHNPPMIIRGNHVCEYLRSKPNFVLGGLSFTKYRTNTAKLYPGDELFLYTDGVTEAANARNELYGEKRLQAFFESRGPEEAETICHKVKEDVYAFADGAPQSDDITMLALRLLAFTGEDYVRTSPKLSSFSLVSSFLEERLGAAEEYAPLLNKVLVSADEVYSNIVNYSKAAYVEARIKMEEGVLTLSFLDNGIPFDPSKMEDPDVTLGVEEREIGGLGIFMAKKLATSFVYERVGHKNLLTMTFATKGAKPSPK